MVGCININIPDTIICLNATTSIGENLRRAYINGRSDINVRYNMSLAAALAMNSMATGELGICHPLNVIIQT